LEVRDTESGEDAIAFVDDTLLLARGKMLAEANDKIKGMMEREGGGLDWVHMHQCNFALDKFRVMGLTRQGRQLLQGQTKQTTADPTAGLRSTSHVKS